MLRPTAAVNSMLLFVAIVFLISSCKKNTNQSEDIVIEVSAPVSSHENRVVSDWQSVFLQVEKNAAVYRPCPAPRMLAYVGLAVYESCISGMPNFKSIAYLYPGLNIPAVDKAKAYHYPLVLNAVYNDLFQHFFVNVQFSDKVRIDSVAHALDSLFSDKMDPELIDRSKRYGVAVAEAIWNYAANDIAGHNKYQDPHPSSYFPPIGAGYWKPTPPGNGAALFPYWGSVRTFAISASDKLCLPPIPYATASVSDYYNQAMQVYAKTSNQTSENQWIAEFWSDDILGLTFSPASRWLAIENQLLEIESSNLETAIVLSLKLGIALNDASVGCWYSKYTYNVESPVTAIHEILGYTNWNIAGLTSTNFINSTPAYPEYPNDHATFAAAAAEVFSDAFGTTYNFTDRCHQTRTEFNGTPRSFASFSAMAAECAISRVYLGVDFPMSGTEGLRFGTAIGQKVNELPLKK